ncbi:MAG: spore coat protein [Spirochaetaceae bacterium]|jgi:spore coat polysaccharide biosynthesis protein SpsF|nr:spore coat protein [Spirochaetaceae bacterium]
MTAVILQARLDSSRLPKKALLDLCGEPVIVRVMQALKKIDAQMHILACPHDSFDTFLPLTKKCGFEIFAGSKNDVLDRYCGAIKHFDIGSSRIIRATGDNPFVFADAAELINNEAIALKADYAAYSGMPYGAGVESVPAEALLKANAETSSEYDREHVCPYFYNNPQYFKLHRPLAPALWQNPALRLTIDTEDDYEHACYLYRALIEGCAPALQHCGSTITSFFSS